MTYFRRVLNLLLEKKLSTKEQLLEIVEPPYFTPEKTPLNLQLLHFPKMRRRSCFVVDEYGNLQGLATMEDILEEIVGEYTTDVSSIGQDIIPQDDGTYIIDATITLRQLNRTLGCHFSTEGPKTLSGLIIEHLGYIPPADCCLRIGAYQLDILKLSDNTIRSVRLKKMVPRVS